MYEIIKEINQKLNRDLSFDSFLEMYENTWEMDQEFHRGLLLIFLIERVWNQ